MENMMSQSVEKRLKCIFSLNADTFDRRDNAGV